MNNKISRLITQANLMIAVIIVAILFVLYDYQPTINGWAKIIGKQWIWVPIVLILFAAILYAAILYGRFFFRKKNRYISGSKRFYS
jgi:hypothetical protein